MIVPEHEELMQRAIPPINRINLEQSWAEQEELVDKWAQRLADAEYYLDRKEAFLEKHRAYLDLRIRAYPKRYGLNKVTEGGVKSAISLDKKHWRLERNVHEAKHLVNRLKGVMRRLDNRKTGMVEIRTLNLYLKYAKPIDPYDEREAREDYRSERRKLEYDKSRPPNKRTKDA
jgi:hypothetical protein